MVLLNITLHTALLASVCDVPATAKLCGVLSHTSKHACWKCSKLFPYDKTLNHVNFARVELGSLREYDIHKKMRGTHWMLLPGHKGVN